MVARNDFLSKEQIRVLHEDAVWIIRGRKRTVTFNETNFKVDLTAEKAAWPMIVSQPDDLVVGVKGTLVPMSFPAAKFREISHYDTGAIGGVLIHLKEFVHPEHGAVDLELRLIIAMEIATEEIIFQIIPAEKDVLIHECRWPKMIDPQSVDMTVVPNMQGVLIPRNFDRKIVQYDDRMYGRGFYMPWWGYQKGPAAAMMIVETPVDAAAKVDHPAGADLQSTE